ncbi:MAG: hypothetical protein ACI8XM_002414, partial [Haloarculaceae archaeon]
SPVYEPGRMLKIAVTAINRPAYAPSVLYILDKCLLPPGKTRETPLWLPPER